MNWLVNLENMVKGVMLISLMSALRHTFLLSLTSSCQYLNTTVLQGLVAVLDIGNKRCMTSAPPSLNTNTQSIRKPGEQTPLPAALFVCC